MLYPVKISIKLPIMLSFFILLSLSLSLGRTVTCDVVKVFTKDLINYTQLCSTLTEVYLLQAYRVFPELALLQCGSD